MSLWIPVLHCWTWRLIWKSADIDAQVNAEICHMAVWIYSWDSHLTKISSEFIDIISIYNVALSLQPSPLLSLLLAASPNITPVTFTVLPILPPPRQPRHGFRFRKDFLFQPAQLGHHELHLGASCSHHFCFILHSSHLSHSLKCRHSSDLLQCWPEGKELLQFNKSRTEHIQILSYLWTN